ncbi:MAG: NERD domain-containing protein [Acholeplasmataceae bacterium]|nr:NERD domain-containing protein [Acholeplasmataceae bacterium]
MEIFIYVGIGLVLVLVIFFISKIEKRSRNHSEALREIGESDPKHDHYVLSDIQFHDGIRQAKIDHLVVNSSGIHAVIEYQYQGTIKGDKDDEQWSYEYKGVSDVFENPMLTARDLKLSIDKVLKKDYPLFLYIVFPEHTSIKKRKSNVPMLLSNELKDEMHQNFKSKKKISSKDVSLIHNLFLKVKNK